MMFGSSPAKKLRKCLVQAMKAFGTNREKEFEQHLQSAQELIDQHEDETNSDFFASMQMLSLLMLEAGQASRGLSLQKEILDRAERLGQDRTAFFALACKTYACLIRLNLRDSEAEGREVIEKGISHALEGDKTELLRLAALLGGYLEELKGQKLSKLIPGLMRQAREVYERKLGPNSMVLAAVLVVFAAALYKEELPEATALALDAADHAHQILLKQKSDEDQLASTTVLKARLLQDSGRLDEAAALLRETAERIKGSFLPSVLKELALAELDRGQDTRTVEPIAQRGLKALGKAADAELKASLLSIQGFCAALRGDEKVAVQAVLQIEAALAQGAPSKAKPSDDEDEAHEHVTSLLASLEYVARGFYFGGFQENALDVIERALEHAGGLEAKFPEELQGVLAHKALILSRLGRHQEAEALLFGQVLERLDDINQLDTRRHAEALIDLGEAWIEQGEFGRARAALKNAWAMSAEQDGKESEMAGHIYVMMGKLLLRMNQAAQARDVLRRGRNTLLAHGAVGFRARAIFEEFRRLQAGTA